MARAAPGRLRCHADNRYHNREHPNEFGGGGHDGPGEFDRERGASEHEHGRPEAAAAAAVGVRAVSIPMTVLLLVSGCGLSSLADLAGELVDGAGAGALDTALALAPGADLDPPTVAALDVPGALALRAGAERMQVQRPDPHAGGDGRDGLTVPRCLRARLRAVV